MVNMLASSPGKLPPLGSPVLSRSEHQCKFQELARRPPPIGSALLHASPMCTAGHMHMACLSSLRVHMVCELLAACTRCAQTS
eukprot:2790492-Pleurochrysis_carterae.AAC.2